MKRKPAFGWVLVPFAACTWLLTATAAVGPVITATKDDNLGPGLRKQVGDQITYTVTIGNTGSTATSVLFTDPDPANTTFVSVNSTPIARDDTYAAIGNVQITIPAPGVLANDNDPDDAVNGAGTLTVSAAPSTTTQGGNLSVSANGGFTYNPAPGFMGADTFTYTLSDGEGKTDTATVTINVTGVIWFINASAGAGGDGRLTAPFNSIAAFNSTAADEAGDNIFLYTGTYTTPPTVLNNERLIGQGATASIASITGLSVPTGSLALPTTGGTRPTISVSSGTGITLAVGNTVDGLNVSNSNGNGITGSAVGTLTLADFDVTVTGGTALSLTTSGTVTATGTDNDLSSSNGTALNLTSVTIGAAGLTFKSISSGSASNSSGNGIILDTTGTAGGLTVTGSGTAGSGGTIQHKNGADGSTTQGSGIYLNSTSGVSLSRMQLNDFQNFGIRGANVTGFSLSNSTINGINGTTDAGGSEEGAIRFDGLFTTGSFTAAQTATISGCTISGSYSDNLRVQNASGTLSRITVDNCTFGLLNDSITNGGNNLVFDGAAGTTMNITLTSSTITGARGQLLIVTGHGGGHMDVVVRGNRFYNTDTHTLSAGGGVVLQGGDLGIADFTFDVSYNRFKGTKGAALNIYKATNTTGGAFTGTVKGNQIGDPLVAGSGAPNSAPALWIQDHGAGTYTVLIRDNDIVQYGEEAIDLQSTQGSGTLNASIFNNTVSPDPDNGFSGLNIEPGAIISDSGTMNVVVGSFATAGDKNNFSTGDAFDFSDIRVLRASSTTVLNLSKN